MVATSTELNCSTSTAALVASINPDMTSLVEKCDWTELDASCVGCEEEHPSLSRKVCSLEHPPETGWAAASTCPSVKPSLWPYIALHFLLNAT
jgi:hypothetical protein